MRPRLLLLSLAAQALYAFAQPSPVLPCIAVRTQEGRSLALESWRGEIVVVAFWATWCVSCRRELDALQKLHDLQPRPVRILAIALDSAGWRTVTPLLRERRIRVPVTLGSRPVLRGFGFTSPPATLPLTLVFNRQGLLVASLRTGLGVEDLSALLEEVH